MRRKKRFLAALFLVLTVLSANQTASANFSNLQNLQFLNAGKFYRTELYFGMNKGDETIVSEEEWKKFLETEVTPRFPKGFTVMESYGQYKNAAGKVVREQSRVLILFYPKNERREVNSKIEELRAAYKKQFAQETVLRMDFRQPVAVDF